jgi:hypothetical protein
VDVADGAGTGAIAGLVVGASSALSCRGAIGVGVGSEDPVACFLIATTAFGSKSSVAAIAVVCARILAVLRVGRNVPCMPVHYLRRTRCHNSCRPCLKK